MYIQRSMYIHGIYVVYTDYIPHRGTSSGFQPRVGGLSVAKTERIWRKSRSDAAKQAWATSGPALASDFLLEYTRYIHGIYTVISSCKFELLSCYAMLCTCISGSFNFPGFPVSVPKLKITETSRCMAYTINIPGIC